MKRRKAMTRSPMSEATKEKLRESYRLRVLGQEEILVNKKPNESRIAEEMEYVVTKVCLNPRLVEGDGESGVRNLVDVGRNYNFAIGDKIVVRRHEEEMGVLQFARMSDEGLAVDHVGLPRDKRRVFRD